MTRIYTYGEKYPKRDHFSIFGQRPEYGGGLIAVRMTMDEERHFLALYGRHSPECRWSYGIPKGARVVAENTGIEPEPCGPSD